MRKITFLFFFIFLGLFVFGQNGKIELNPSNAKSIVQEDDATVFRTTFSFSSVESKSFTNDKGSFSEIYIGGSVTRGYNGDPALPTVPRILCVPIGATVSVNVNSYNVEEYELSAYDINTISAKQASIRKSIDPSTVEYQVNDDSYARDDYNESPLAEVEELGNLRGMRLVKLMVNPVQYNPTANSVKVYNDIDVSVNFEDGDVAATTNLLYNTYSPAFEPVYAQIANSGIKSVYDDYPDKYNVPIKTLVICADAYETALEPWVEWKTKKGYYVEVYNTSTAGTTSSAISSFIQTKYNASVSAGNAYTYLMTVGDDDDIPASADDYNSDAQDNVETDLEYSSPDGDNYPDMYYSRMSVESATHVTNYINKVLIYEKYEMSDPSYLNNVILVGGYDSSWTSNVGGPTINYATTNYFNSSNTTYGGFGSGTINATIATSSTSGFTGTNNGCYNGVNDGVCFMNYTAHGDEQMWYQPKLDASDIPDMTNSENYFFAVGNCCLTGSFNNTGTTYSPGSDIGTDACFAETMIRVPDKGAIGYIGSAPYSYWYEDFYWDVGAHSYSAGSYPTVAASSMGVYDAMFEDGYWNSIGALLFVGNLAVQYAENTGYTTSVGGEYYWKYYHVFGDASVMPYITEPEANTVTCSSSILAGATTFTVNAESGSYVAITDGTSTIYGVAEANTSGVASLTLSNLPTSGNTVELTVTRQQRQPYFQTISIVAPDPPTADFTGTPTSIMEGQSVTFTDASTNASSYSWNFGDSGTSIEENPVHTYTAIGTYTVALTVTNSLGNDTETKTDYITVTENTNPPTADFEASETVISVYGSIDYTDLTVDNPTSWSWVFEGGTPSTSTDQNPTGITYNTSGTYKVTLTATNDHGSDVEEKLLYITVSAPLYCDAEGTDEDEYISNVTFGDIDNDSDWDGYADYTSTQSTNVTVGDSYSIGITDEVSYSQDEALVWIDYNIDGDFEDSGELVYEGAALGGTSTHNPYTWAGTIDIPLTATIGTTRMRVRLNYNTSFSGSTPNSEPCGDGTYGEVEDYPVVIQAIETVPVADFSVDATSGCETLAVSFTDLSTGVPTSWAWTFGDGGTSSVQNPTYTYSTPGTYTVTLTASNAVDSNVATYTDLITIDATPTVDDPSDVTACESYILPALTSGAYFETTGGVNPITVGTTITSDQTIYVYAANGTCTDENSFTVTIDAMPTVDDPSDVEECDSYTLPSLSNGEYYSNSGGSGAISVGTDITSTQTIYVYASNGICEVENSFVVTIHAGFTASATAIDETGVGNTDGSVTVNMIGGTPDFDGLWSNGASTTTTGTSMIQTGLTGGYYTVTVTDDNGCTAEADATVNTTGAVPEANFSADVVSGCDNLVVTFTDLTNNTPTSWAWTFGDGQTSTDQNPVHTYSNAGIYTVTLTATNGNGSDDITKTDYIVVGETPVLTMSMTEETVAGNDGTSSVSVTGGTTPYIYEWSNGETTASISNIVAGNYCVTVTEANGCAATECIEVTQESVSNEPVANFSADDTEACGTLTVNFTDLSTNTPTSWSWSFGDGQTSTDQNPEHTYNVAGVYTVALHVENADGNDDMTMVDYINVYENPAITVDVTNASGATAADGSATANVTGGTTPYVITWSTSENGTSIFNLLPGNYSVFVQDNHSCIATSPFIIDWDTFTEINELAYSIYPNPAYDMLHVQFDGQLCETIEIYDMLGQIVNTVNPSEDNVAVDVSFMKTGIYFVKVIFADKEFTHKIVVK